LRGFFFSGRCCLSLLAAPFLEPLCIVFEHQPFEQVPCDGAFFLEQLADGFELALQVVGDGPLARIEHQHVGGAVQSQSNLLQAIHKRLRCRPRNV